MKIMSEEETMMDMFKAQKKHTVATYGVCQFLKPMSKFSEALSIYGSSEIPDGAIEKTVKRLFRNVAYNGHRPYSPLKFDITSESDTQIDVLISVSTVKDI